MAARFQSTLQQLGVRYEPDLAAMSALEARAAALGVRLPASLVAHFGMRGAPGLLRRLLSDVAPIGLEHPGDPLEWRWPKRRDRVRDGLLPFLFENQSFRVRAVRLDGSDDPPVLVARDPVLAWRACAPSFSEFMECRAWDQEAAWSGAEPGGPRIILQAQDGPCGRTTCGRPRTSLRSDDDRGERVLARMRGGHACGPRSSTRAGHRPGEARPRPPG